MHRNASNLFQHCVSPILCRCIWSRC